MPLASQELATEMLTAVKSYLLIVKICRMTRRRKRRMMTIMRRIRPS